MSSSSRSIHVPGASHNAPIPSAARVGHVICSSAISGKDAATGLLPADGPTQVLNAFVNMRAVLHAAGASIADVVKLTVYLKDNALRDAINLHWQDYFPDPDDRPARHILNYDLQHGMQLQLEVMAVTQS